jgi:hypothetical protein
VVAILLPLQSLGETVSSLAAGWLAGTVLYGLHAYILSLTFSPIATIYAGAAEEVRIDGLQLLVDQSAIHRSSADSRIGWNTLDSRMNTTYPTQSRYLSQSYV